MLAKLTTKGQITLPKKIRDHLHVKPGDQLDFSVDKDGVVSVAPVTGSVKDLKGCLPKPRKPVTVEQMTEVIKQRGSE